MLRPRHFALPVTAALVAFFAVATPAHAAAGYTWIGSADNSGGDNHSWSDPKNWLPSGVPGDGDSVSIAEPDANHCTAHVDGVPAVALTSFSLASTQCSSSVTGGPITVTSAFSWNGGTLAAPTTIAAGASGTLSGSNSHLNVLSTNLDVAGSLTLSGVVDNGASNQGGFRIAAPNVLHVESTGTLTSDGPNAVQLSACCLSPAKIVNDGTVEVASNDFVLHGIEFDQNGTLAASSGGRLVSDGAPNTAGPGATDSGTGGWFIENTGSLKVDGTQHVDSGFHIELGGAAVNAGSYLGGTGTLTGGGTFDWTGGTVEGNLTIAHDFHVHVYGVHDPAHGNNNGKQFLSGTDGLSGNAAATLTNDGVITVDGGAALLTGWQANLVNASDGTMSLAPGLHVGTLSCCVNPDKIVNHGKVTVPAGSATDSVVLDGVAYQSDGVTSIAAGGLLQVDDAPSSLTSATVSGGGTLTVAAPTTVSGTINVGTATKLRLQGSHGSVNGTATIGGAGSLQWVGGSFSGKVAVTVGGGVAVSGSDGKYVSNIGGGSAASTLTLKTRTSIAAGTSAHHDYISVDSASTLALAATTTVRNYTEIYGGAMINSGSLTVTPGASGTAVRSGPLTNRGTVTVSNGAFEVYDYTQAAGDTKIANGAKLSNLFTSRSITLNGGVLEGTGTVAEGVMNNAGTVKPAGTAIGTLHVTGAYVQGKKGSLALNLAARSRDLLAVKGGVTLAGRLTANDVGSYRPKLGAKVKVLSASGVAYSLTCATTSGSGSKSGHWAPSHTGTAVYVTWRKGADTHC